jgi:branched-chain amino acid transport system substrate-binding protein
MMKRLAITACALWALSSGGAAAESIKMGISTTLSGAAAQWGITMDFVGRQAAEWINSHGGIKVDGKTYTVDVQSYDNKYTAQDGARVAQEMIGRAGIKYVVGALGTAPIRATQSISERSGVILMNIAWGMATKGPKFPYSFTTENTGREIIGPFFDYVHKQHPDAKTVAMINPNDATGKDVSELDGPAWRKLGINVVADEFYERGTTDFSALATKFAQLKPDIINVGMPPGDAGLAIRQLHTLGWKGVIVMESGSSPAQMWQIAGDAMGGARLGCPADFAGPTATDVQRALQAKATKEINTDLTMVSMSSWDGMMALKTAMETAQSVDPKVVRDTLPKIVFESSWGPAAFGRADLYGSPQQILLPVVISRISKGKTVEVARIPSAEFAARIAESKK